jgi:hypothetical protein
MLWEEEGCITAVGEPKKVLFHVFAFGHGEATSSTDDFEVREEAVYRAPCPISVVPARLG